MRLAEALDLSRQPATSGADPKVVHLVCGFTPLHLATFLQAHARLRFTLDGVEVRTGLFGDLIGNLERAKDSAAGEAAVALEWSDLDRRLGLRDAGGWTLDAQADILAETDRAFDRLRQALRSLVETRVVALSAPTLPVPPMGSTSLAQESEFELQLAASLGCFLRDVSRMGGMRVVSRQSLDEKSPAAGRLDARGALGSGFPYTTAHADALAAAFIEALYPPAPKKGLITDLDGTLWRGILGEVGVDGVAWDLAAHAQSHGMYQQFLASLADRGVLIGVASKNEQALVLQALERQDILLPAAKIFPVEANWLAKSASVDRILQAWNIAPDAVVFVDDSAMERAEVESRFPDITCLAFPEKDANEVWRLLLRLRSLFGKPAILEEDRIRSASLKAGAEHAGAQNGSQDEFLRQLAATITLDYSRRPRDDRAFELLNKTNQFNLNGRRFTPGEWRAHLERPESFLATVSYQDKFGPLGRIAVVTGAVDGGLMRVTNWVMSCRAFSRRIEHCTLDRLFQHFGVEAMEFAYCATDRNQPLRDFLASLLENVADDVPLVMERQRFDSACVPLYHQVVEVTDGSDH